jgi:hypothetical protein
MGFHTFLFIKILQSPANQLFLLLPLVSFTCSVFNFLCSFFTSSAAGNSSGLTPLSLSIFLTALLLSICSLLIEVSPFRSFSITLWLVSSAAKSFAFIVSVGKKSASGLLAATPILRFISLVLKPPKSAASPLERMTANPFSSTPRS